ncbi:MAG: arylesterase [Hyphomonadaceae bacterium]|nr:arylesterase [Hyphomonadaceae bacterium]OUX94497.1 MAG: arylesterase [Hyphomonas sp. TMED17]CAI8324948.1 MAG: Carboxylesterase NlhH [Hyphomonas sp. TMED17]
MTSRHLVAPELRPLLEIWPTAKVNAETLPNLRQIRNQASRNLPPPPDTVSVKNHNAPSQNGDATVRVQLTQRKNRQNTAPVILHLHGGGYVLGSPEMTAPQSTNWAEKLNVVVASVDYRLAPETIAPGNVEDAYAALRWLYMQAEALNIDTSRIAVAGESAGGGLAAALALLVRDRGEFQICHQQLIFPMLDDRTATRTDMPDHYGEFIWTPASNYFGWRSLLGHAPGVDNVSPYAAPARADDMSNLPPTFLATGALDLFAEENLDYSKRLMRAGNHIEFHIYPGAPHAFMAWADAEISRQYQRDALAALKRGLAITDEGLKIDPV